MKDTSKVKEAVQKICPEYDVQAVYLYGSFARDQQREDSDIDIGILFEDYSIKKLLEIGRRISDEADLKREVDVRALNSGDLAFQHQVLKEGEIIYESDRPKRAEFERETYRRYIDMKPYRERYYRYMNERIRGAVS